MGCSLVSIEELRREEIGNRAVDESGASSFVRHHHPLVDENHSVSEAECVGSVGADDDRGAGGSHVASLG